MAQVVYDCIRADAERAGNHLMRLAMSNQDYDVALSRRQPAGRPPSRTITQADRTGSLKGEASERFGERDEAFGKEHAGPDRKRAGSAEFAGHVKRLGVARSDASPLGEGYDAAVLIVEARQQSHQRFPEEAAAPQLAETMDWIG